MVYMSHRKHTEPPKTRGDVEQVAPQPDVRNGSYLATTEHYVGPTWSN